MPIFLLYLLKMIFNRIAFDPKVIIRILSDPKVHWSINRVSFAYLADTRSESIINFHHNDCEICPTIDDLNLMDTMYSFPQIVDPERSSCETEPFTRSFRNAELAYWFKTGKRLDIQPDWTIRQYWDMGIPDVNDVVPIMRWIEYCRSIKNAVIGLSTNVPAFDEYEKFIINLRKIESIGLRSVK